MTCPEVVSYLDDLVDGSLSPDKSERVRDHIRRCEACRREFEMTERLKGLLAISGTLDPGDEYFVETEALILGRTVSNEQPVAAERGVDDTVASRRTALMRALASLAASLAILFAAIYIGSSDDIRQARHSAQVSPVLATADVRQMVGERGGQIFTQADQMRIAHGMLLIGSPGMLGRFAVFPEFDRTIPSGKS